MTMKILVLSVAVGFGCLLEVNGAFGVLSSHHRYAGITSGCRPPLVLGSTSEGEDSGEETGSKLTEKEQTAVGNLIADDEWNGLTMELTEMVRLAISEDLKKNAREFLGKDDYKLGDISKEIDVRVKTEVANLRGKEEYELGDLSLALDKMSKDMTEELTGRPYQPGDLSVELDKRVKAKVADFCGKSEYQVGDLTKEVDRRMKERVKEFTGKDYEFGDITKAIESRRRDWVKEYLGEEAAANYQFGDITKKAVAGLTGKDEYEFGDVSKAILGKLFAGKNTGKKDKE